MGCLIGGACECWPGAHRAGLKAEPGAAPGRGGAQWSRFDSHIRPDSAVGPCLGFSECPF
jgi:hypothetical protein